MANTIMANGGQTMNEFINRLLAPPSARMPNGTYRWCYVDVDPRIEPHVKRQIVTHVDVKRGNKRVRERRVVETKRVTLQDFGRYSPEKLREIRADGHHR